MTSFLEQGADVVAFDPKTKFAVTQKKLHMNVTGMPMLVYSRGAKVAEWDGHGMKFVGKPGRDRFMKREPFQCI